MDGFDPMTDWLWPAALGVIPLAVIAACICRWFSLRASTRHALWLTVLLCLFVPPILPAGELIPRAQFTSRPAGAPGRPASPSGLSWLLPRTAAPTLPDHAARPSHLRERSWSSRDRAPAFTWNGGPASPVDAMLAPALLQLERSSAKEPSLRTSERPPWARGSKNAAVPNRPEAPATKPVEAPAVAAAVHPAPDAVRETAPPPAIASETAPAPLDPGATVGDRAGAPPAVSAAGATDSPSPTASTSDARPSVWARELAAWQAWVPRLQDLRDAAAALPPIPSVLWLAGAGVLGLVALTQAITLRRLITSAEPPSDPVREMVESAARTIGLRRVPDILMVSARVSPMVSCWGRSRLILPRELWDELDQIGREAVVLHELAHLRRRDHWVCYAEIAAAAIFWWHPVVWWVRQRLREEADACCDAWVTALRPRDRRSYAQALLDTRAYLSRPTRAVPGVGLGVNGSGAKRFARRLTMVMKERAKPRLSVCGVALAATLGLIGAASTPLWACPPDEKSQKDKGAEHTKATGQHEHQEALAQALTEAQVSRERAAKDRDKALKTAQKQREQALKQAQKQREQAMKQAEKQRAHALKDAESQRAKALKEAELQRAEAMAGTPAAKARGGTAVARPRTPRPPAPIAGGGPNEGPGVSDAQRRMEQLERRLQRLEEQLGRLEQSLDRRGSTSRGPRSLAPLSTPAPPGMAVFAAPAAVAAPAAPAAPGACSTPCPARAPEAPAPPAPPEPPAATPISGITLLEVPVTPMLTTNMAPVLTYTQQSPTFNVTTPQLVQVEQVEQPGQVEARTYSIPEGIRGDLWALMARQDVPIIVASADDGMVVNATPRQHAVFAAFLNMIHPGAVENPPPLGAIYGLDQPLTMHAPALLALAENTAHLHAALSGLHEALNGLAARADELSAQAEELAGRAEELEGQADELEEQSKALEEKAEDLEGEARAEALAGAREMLVRARTLREQAREIEAQAEELSEQAEQVREEAESIRETADEAEQEAAEAEGDCDEECAEGCEGCEGDCGDCCDDKDEAGDKDDPDDDDDDDNDDDDGKIDTLR